MGDVSCNVNTLQDDKLFLDPPTTTPRSRTKRQRRDTTSEPLDLLVGSRCTAPPLLYVTAYKLHLLTDWIARAFSCVIKRNWY